VLQFKKVLNEISERRVLNKLDKKQYLGIDIGGTFIKYGTVDKTGNILTADTTPTSKEIEPLLQTIEDIIARNHPENLYGVGISSPGRIDIEAGIIRHGGSLTFLNGLALEKHITETFSLPSVLINDAQAATMAEQWVGNLSDVANGMVITLGTGLGGGIILNNALYSGTNNQAGEISWMFRNIKDISGEGMLGNEISAVQFVKKAAQELDLTDETDGRSVFEAIKAGENKILLRYFEEFSKNIAWLILNLQSVLDVEKFLIGGGISRQDILLEEVNRQYTKLRSEFPYFNEHFLPVVIEVCKYHNDANILGAVYQLLVKLEDVK
jgi:predicted NBD/HSP70 family sugar kinase